MPNVRAKREPTAGHRARAGENVRAPPARARWPAVGAPLERGVRRHLHLGSPRFLVFVEVQLTSILGVSSHTL